MVQPSAFWWHCQEPILWICFLCLLFCILATSKGWASSCDSVISWQLYSAAPPKPGCQHHNLISHSLTLSWHWANQSWLYPTNDVCLARKWQVSILKSLVWFDPGLNPQGLDSPISQNGGWALYSFGHSVCCHVVGSSTLCSIYDDDDDEGGGDGEFVSCIVALYTLRKWRWLHSYSNGSTTTSDYWSGEVWSSTLELWDKPGLFVCFTLYHGGDMMYEKRRRKHKFTLLPTQGNLTSHTI